MRDCFRNAATDMIVLEPKLLPIGSAYTSYIRHVHFNEPVFTIPVIIPNAVVDYVSVSIINDRLAVLWKNDSASLDCASASNINVLPKRANRIGDRNLAVKVLAFTIA